MASEYATVQQLRDEGVSISTTTDAQLLRVIRRASALIDNWTKRWFYPRASVILLDGQNSDVLLIGPPIIAVSQVRVLTNDTTVISTTNEVVDLNSIRIYNRHLTQGLVDPDDRCNPKIQYVSSFYGDRRSPVLYPLSWFPRGTQNIEITGIFGYTDFDDGATLWTDGVTPVGKTPDVINAVCIMLVARDLLPLTDLQNRNAQALAARITQERTRDQSVSYSANVAGSLSTSSFGPGIAGNTEIKAMLAPYRRQLQLGSA